MPLVVHYREMKMAPRKVRQVCDLLRRKKASEAIDILRFCDKQGVALMLTKLINSALTKASELNEYDLDELYVKEIVVDKGRVMKRVRPCGRGRGATILKRSSHVRLKLEEKSKG